MFRVVVAFADMQDGGYIYEVGEEFPRVGVNVSKERLEELSSNRNRRGVVLIANEAPEKASPVAEKTPETFNPIETPVERSKPKRRERKGKERNA